MSPRAPHHRRRRLGAILAAGSALAIGIGVIIGNQVTGGGGGGGSSLFTPPTTFNVFVSPAASGGNDSTTPCTTRQSTAVANNPSGVNTGCATFTKAYQVAQCGDNIGVYAPSAYLGQAISPTVQKTTASAGCSGASDPSGPGCRYAATYEDGTTQTQDLTKCVTFAPAGGATTATIGTAGSLNVLNSGASYVHFYNITMPDATDGTTHGVYTVTGQGLSSTECSQFDTRDVIVEGFNGTAIFTTGAQYVTWQGGDVGPNYIATTPAGSAAAISQSFPCQPQLSTKTSITAPTHVVFDHVTWHDQTNNNTGNHSECFHYNIGDFFNFTHDKFFNCIQQGISIEPDIPGCVGAACTTYTASVNHVKVENTVFDKPCSDQSAAISAGFNCAAISELTMIMCHRALSDLDNIDINYSSFDAGGSPKPQTDAAVGCTDTAALAFNGNVTNGCQTSSGFTITWRYNVMLNGASCGTGPASGTASAIYVSPSSTNFDYTLQSASTPLGFVPTSEPCPADDVRSAVRPTGVSACSAGAYQGVGGSP